MADEPVSPAAQQVEVAGRPVRCLIAGAGPPVLLLHGNGTSADDWAWALPRLATRFRVHAPDLQHVPPRGAPIGTPAPVFEPAFVLGLLDALGLPAAALVGSSLGGLLALETALAAPERVPALVLADSAGLGPAIHPALQALTTPRYGDAAIAWARTPLGSLQRAWARAGLLFALPTRVPPAWVASQARLAQQPGFLAATLASLRQQVGLGGQRTIVLPQLPQLVMPVLVLWGEHDRVVPARQGREACAQLARGQLALLPGCGHLPHVERPAVFAETVGRFLAA